MTARLDLGREKRCDGMDLSVLSPSTADTGFSLTTADALAYADDTEAVREMEPKARLVALDDASLERPESRPLRLRHEAA